MGPLERSGGRSRTVSTTATTAKAEGKKEMKLFEMEQVRIFAVLLLFLASMANSSRASVVRPTIFSDLNASDAAQVQSQQQQQQQNGQQQANSQQQQQQSSNPAALADGTNHLLQTSTTKITINPYKSRFCTALNGARTDSPLGLQSLAIDDFALSASSYSNEQVGPHLARLNQDISGGAWCPVKPISGSNFGKEWIQVKLNRSFVVNAIETQGRFGMGNGKEFVPSYQVEYSRNGGQSWHKWKDFRGSSLLRGNDDVNTAVKNELSPPIVGANVIRILPYSQHLRTVCLRFELHGCQYDEGAPIAYATSDGVVEPRWGHLIDYTYDGVRQRGLLTNGLGQLVDGVKGPDNFSHNNGFEWVGWKSMNGDVVIEFTFKTVRNFTGALFHSNNLFSSGVEVFQGVDVHYGIDVPLSMEALRDSQLEQQRRDALLRPARQLDGGNLTPDGATSQLATTTATTATLWSPDVLSIEYEPDKKLENSRPVTVHLKQRLANKLRFVLKFASKWILVSEVEFLSHPVELLSLSTLQDLYTLTLMRALAPAKSYDEYVAILREHQLRRIATNAYLESFQGSSSTPPSSPSSANTINNDGPPSDQPETTSDRFNPYTNDDNLPAGGSPYSATNFATATKRIPGPAIPVWQNTGMDPSAPSTNPMLNPIVPLTSPFHPPIFPPPSSVPNEISSSSQSGDMFNTSKESSSSSSLSEKRTLGLAAVISFVLVLILVILGVLFAISSYRLRHQPKLGAHALPRHLSSNHHSHLPNKGGLVNGGGLHNFMSVFSSAATNQQQYPNDNNHYNAIFDTGSSGHQNHEASIRAASTLKRLATLTGSQKNAHPLLSQHQTAHHQLLVSVKDSPGATQPLFGTGGQMSKLGGGQQQVSTQLIVGLNQANPLAQQQIYNNSSNMNCSNQTYATHYSTSMSMASSSTTGNQGDYADYAIPDAQPMIPPLLASNHHRHNAVATAGHSHQHLNHAFNGSSSPNNQFKPPFGYQTEMRPSHRNAVGHQTTLIQPQVIQQQRPANEHNYELIYQDQRTTRPSEQQLQHQITFGNNHSRTLSNQLVNCQQQTPAFSSMTLSNNNNNRQFLNDTTNHQQQPLAGKRALPQQVSQECSPGGASSSGSSAGGQSGATTATTSANSSGAGDLNSAHPYYYAGASEPNTQQRK